MVPWEEWERLTIKTVKPDSLDLAMIRDFMDSDPEDLEPAPETNPIRKARVASGILQTDLAAAMGITQGRLSQLEMSTARPAAVTVERAKKAVRTLCGKGH